MKHVQHNMLAISFPTDHHFQRAQINRHPPKITYLDTEKMSFLTLLGITPIPVAPIPMSKTR